MNKKIHPYKRLPDRQLWPRAVGNQHFADIQELWQPFEINKTDKIATAGSCFAQHLGRNLKRRGANFLDMEPSPPFFADETEANNWGFGVFSCRYGNIYTVRQLVQLFDEAFSDRNPKEIVWERGGRFFDALRSGVDPLGWETQEMVMNLREIHLEKVRAMFCSLDVFVFTLGLTEAWESNLDGSVFPNAPGVVAGEYQENKYSFRNFKYPEIVQDLEIFWSKLRSINNSAQMLLTVSPVPLMATASNDHVLVATSQSKSSLRAAAGDFSECADGVYYFPSYEIIVSPQAYGMAYNPDKRTVNQFGVDLVMKHFFSGVIGEEFNGGNVMHEEKYDLICDEELLSKC